MVFKNWQGTAELIFCSLIGLGSGSKKLPLKWHSISDLIPSLRKLKLIFCLTRPDEKIYEDAWIFSLKRKFIFRTFEWMGQKNGA